MGIALMKEVLTCAPDDLGPSERMVLMVIAENARDATRESWALTREDLGQRAGLKPEALRKAFQRLAKAGLEVRVPLKIGENGKPVYAYEGHRQSTYRVPRLKRREQIPTTEAGTESHHSSQEAGTQSQHSQEAGTNSHHSATQAHSSRSRAEGSPAEAGTQSGLWEPEVGTDSQEVGTGSRPTPHNPSSTSPTEKYKKGGAGGKRRRKGNADEHPRFAEWYAQYPLRKERASASKAFNNAAAKVDDVEILFVGVKRYVESDANVHRGYIKYPATWLNKECWLDEPAPQAQSNGHPRGGALDNVNSHDWSGWETKTSGGSRR